MKKIKVKNEGLASGIWFMSWLFTLGFLELSFWQGVLAIVVWPYYLGSFLRVFWGI